MCIRDRTEGTAAGCVLGSSLHVRQIFINILGNAIKYTDAGGHVLCQVTIKAIGESRISCRAVISDNGIGMSTAFLPHLFESFSRENTDEKSVTQGTGLGMSIVKHLVDEMGGTITVESKKGVGTTFTVTLLFEEPKEQEGKKIEEGDESADLSGMRVLLAEDNELNMEIAETFLTDAGVQITKAYNGKEEVERYLEQPAGTFDAILTDLMMPVMDGITLCRQLKEDVRTSHIPVILLTAKDSLQDKEEGYEVGADSYLTKPFSASLLRSRINNLLDSRKKLIAQFQQAGTNHNPNSHLDEKRSIITEALSKLDNEFIEKITQLVEDNLSSEKIDITYLSDKMCMSGSTLYRKMKALTGLSTNEYIRKVKMQNAERLLLEGKFNISEIAYKVGMNSTGYFRQCFKEEFGVSPSDYLKQIIQS